MKLAFIHAFAWVPLIDRLITISTRISFRTRIRFHGVYFPNAYSLASLRNWFPVIGLRCSRCKHSVIWWRFQIVSTATAVNGKREKRELNADNERRFDGSLPVLLSPRKPTSTLWIPRSLSGYILRYLRRVTRRYLSRTTRSETEHGYRRRIIYRR